jgi:hypothetical protein
MTNPPTRTSAPNNPHHVVVHNLGTCSGRTPEKAPGGCTHVLVVGDKFTKWIKV